MAFDDPPLVPEPTPAHPALVLAVYGEELAQGARVAVFGDVTVGLAQELVARGARLVHAYDTDAGRVAEATARAHDRAIYFARLPEGGDAGVRDGAFDLVMLPDLSACDDPAAVLAVARRVLSSQGAAIIASPNPDARPLVGVRSRGVALGYYELYEAVVAHFPSVRMLGQVPFVGYAVAEFAAIDPEPTIDSSLSTQREPEWFVALASERGVRLEPFALVELPSPAPQRAPPAASVGVGVGNDAATAPPGSVGGTVLANIFDAEREAALEALRQQEQLVANERGRANQLNQALSAARDELGLQRERTAMLDREIAAREAAQQELEAALVARQSATDKLAHELATRHSDHDKLAQELTARRAENDRLIAELTARHTASDRLTRELAALQTANGKLEAERADVEPMRARVRALETALGEAVEQQRKAARASASDDEQRARQATAELEQRVRQATSQQEQRAAQGIAAHDERARQATADHERDVARLETQLRDLGHETTELRAEVARREKLVRELVATYVTSQDTAPEPLAAPAPADAPPSTNGSAQLERMSFEAATREADLVAAQWKIAQLERELGQRR